MYHAPYQRIVPGAKKAVLLIHGILSTPRFFDAYVSALPEDVSVHSLLLPGHGGSVQDFGRVPRGAWLQHVREALQALRAQHEEVYVAAHSLGTLLALHCVTDDPTLAKELLLIAVPLHIRVKPRSFIANILKGVGLTESRETLQHYYGTAQDWRVWRYIGWIPRYLELFSLCRSARRILPRLATPARVFTARQDELVSPRSGRLLSELPCVTLTELPASSHHEFADNDLILILSSLKDMIA